MTFSVRPFVGVNGWGEMKFVLAMEGGVLAVTQAGDLRFYAHDGSDAQAELLGVIGHSGWNTFIHMTASWSGSLYATRKPELRC